MKHIMLDIYGTKRQLSGMTEVNELLNTVTKELSLLPVMPPENIPYYYSAVPEDGGVSSYCILDGGHITVHTFPFYSNCYVDILYGDFDGKRAEELFFELLEPDNQKVWCFDRDLEKCEVGYNPESDFGPHLLVNARFEKAPGMCEIYEILDTLPEKVGMRPIMRPRVITNRTDGFDIISGMSIIAESHVALHSNIKTGRVYFDLYSCKFCAPEKLIAAVSDLFGDGCEYQLISRGSKKGAVGEERGYTLSYNGWRENI